MGFFSSSKKKKELREAKASLKSLEKRKSAKMATSTIDPTKALNELQPWQVNQEKTTKTLSSLTHKDIWGNEIKEPDLTNPTRNRWERPLDTVRAFQESIDRGYRRSYYGAETDPNGAESTRNSNAHRYDGATDQFYPHSHRMVNSGTPMSNNSFEDHGFGVGAMSSRNVLNDTLVMNQRPGGRTHNYSNTQNNGYPEPSYDPNYPRSSPGYDSDGYGGGGQSYTTSPAPQPISSPLQQQMSAASPRPMISPQPTSQPTPQPMTQSVPRTIQLGGGSSTPATAAPVPPPPQEKKRKSFFGKRLSKNK